LIKKIAELSMKHRFIVLGGAIVITIFFVTQSFKIQIETKLEDLLPQNHPFIKVHNKYEKQLGTPFKIYLLLKVKNGDIYNQETLKKSQEINDALDAIPGVDHNQVYSIASRKIKKVNVTSDALITENLMTFVPATREEMENFKNTVENTGGVYGYWVAGDEKALLFSAAFIPRLTKVTVLHQKIIELIKRYSDPNHELYACGEPILAGTIASYKKEIFFILVLSVSSIIIVLFLYFRNLVGTVVPVTCSILCAIWGLGFTSLLGYNLDPLGLVIPLLISARALSHAVQMTERYFEEYHEIKDVKKAVVSAITKNFPPGAVGIFTDCLGILLIAVAPIPLLQKLAYGGAFWAGSNIFNALIFTPVFLSFFSPPKNIDRIVDMEVGVSEKILGVMAKAVTGKRCYVTFGVTVVVAIFSLYIGLQIKIGDVHPGTPILWQNSEYNVAVAEINKRFPGTEELYVIFGGTGDRVTQTPGYLDLLESFQRHMEKDPKVGLTFSVRDFLPLLSKNVFGGYFKFDMVPENEKKISTLFYLLRANSAPSDYDLYLSRNGQDANVIVWFKDHMGDTIRQGIEEVQKFIAKEKGELAKAKVKVQLASGNIGLLAAINESVESAQLLNFVLIMVAYFAVSTYTFKTIKCPLLLSIPLNMSNLITLAVMHFMGIGLNINTLPIVSLGIGVGDDYGLYIYSRIVEEYQKHKNYKDAFNVALKTSGKAVFFTASTMAFATAFWYFISDLRFQAEMGLLLTIVMGLNMILALIVIPCLMYVVKFKPRTIS